MRRILCLVLVCAGVIALSFAVREFVSRDTARYFDGECGYSVYHAETGAEAETAVADARLALYDGIVIDADTGFEHRCFYVRTWDGHVAVFNWCGSLCNETGVVIGSLDAGTRSLIEKGIYFNTFESAQQFIESL